MKASSIIFGNQFQNFKARRALLAAGLVMAKFLMPAISHAAPRHKENAAGQASPDRAAIENLQRWVSAGHDAWCKDAALVASAEMRRLAPQFSGEQFDLVALPLAVESTTARRATFSWTTLDGKTTYRVTVLRYAWLQPIAHDAKSIVWVPVSREVVAGE